MTLAHFAGRNRQGVWSAVIGVFDPFTLTVARAIHEHSKPGRDLLVVVTPGENTLLSAEARAAMLAALRDVDAVAIAEPEEARAVLNGMPAVEVFEDPAADRERSQDFVDFVLARQASASERRG